MVGFGHLNLPGLEKNQSTMAQRNSTKGITCTAFSANLTRAFSFLANSTMGSYPGSSLTLLSNEFVGLRLGGAALDGGSE